MSNSQFKMDDSAQNLLARVIFSRLLCEGWYAYNRKSDLHCADFSFPSCPLSTQNRASPRGCLEHICDNVVEDISSIRA